jgi:hypothetical protein
MHKKRLKPVVCWLRIKIGKYMEDKYVSGIVSTYVVALCRSWLRHSGTSQKVAGSILGGVIGTFY